MGELMALVLLGLLNLEVAEPAAPPRGPWLGSPAAAVVAEMQALDFDPDAAEDLLAVERSPAPYREILFYGEGPAVRMAARCLVVLRDGETVQRIVRLAETDSLGPARYPAALFGWVAGASYDGTLMPRIRQLLSSQDTHTRIFAVEAARTLTFLGWRMPEEEPPFANPGEAWALRRWCYRHGGTNPDVWLRERARAALEGAGGDDECREMRRFLARFRRA
ncbi:MAG: hypothetical protein JXQ29_03875 [Planctomycetes bacterium]|nr:hypothetical protein [Planctomycetota bacterium]